MGDNETVILLPKTACYLVEKLVCGSIQMRYCHVSHDILHSIQTRWYSLQIGNIEHKFKAESFNNFTRYRQSYPNLRMLTGSDIHFFFTILSMSIGLFDIVLCMHSIRA